MQRLVRGRDERPQEEDQANGQDSRDGCNVWFNSKELYKFQRRKIVVKDTTRGSEIKSFQMKYYNNTSLDYNNYKCITFLFLFASGFAIQSRDPSVLGNVTSFVNEKNKILWSSQPCNSILLHWMVVATRNGTSAANCYVPQEMIFNAVDEMWLDIPLLDFPRWIIR